MHPIKPWLFLLAYEIKQFKFDRPGLKAEVTQFPAHSLKLFTEIVNYFWLKVLTKYKKN